MLNVNCAIVNHNYVYALDWENERKKKITQNFVSDMRPKYFSISILFRQRWSFITAFHLSHAFYLSFRTHSQTPIAAVMAMNSQICGLKAKKIKSVLFVIWPLPSPPPSPPSQQQHQPLKLLKGNQLIMLLNHERYVRVRGALRVCVNAHHRTIKEEIQRNNIKTIVFFFSRSLLECGELRREQKHERIRNEMRAQYNDHNSNECSSNHFIRQNSNEKEN